jgi:hypothetical protein
VSVENRKALARRAESCLSLDAVWRGRLVVVVVGRRPAAHAPSRRAT